MCLLVISFSCVSFPFLFTVDSHSRPPADRTASTPSIPRSTCYTCLACLELRIEVSDKRKRKEHSIPYIRSVSSVNPVLPLAEVE